MNIQRVKFKDIEQVPYLKLQKKFKEDFLGSSPAPFVGRYGYPHVNVGILSPQITGDTSYYDSPQSWSRNNLPIGTIANLRYDLVNSRSKAQISDVRTPTTFLEICQEVGMAKRSVELEVNLNSKPKLQHNPEREIIPFGPQAEIRRARITANVKVDPAVDKIVSDTDLKAVSGIISLYKQGFEESFINRLISVGNLGLKKNRKLVPTRWSITAVDDTIGKELIKEVKDCPMGDYQLYFGGGWGNYYLILFFPEVWSYELFEMYLGRKVNEWSKTGNFYSTDHEFYEGRKTYAEECAGGYYANRLGTLEKMKREKRQFSCLSLRFISNEYNVPLGVWVCREATRKSLQNKSLHFASVELMIKYAQELIQRKFGFDLNLLLKESKLLKNKKEQKKLLNFG